jgi:cell division protein ZapA
MTNEETNTVAINILGKEYLINCPEESQPGLLSSAKYLDHKMREIKTAGKIYGLERIAVMAALNLSHELYIARNEKTQANLSTQRLKERIEQSLSTDPSKPAAPKQPVE